MNVFEECLIPAFSLIDPDEKGKRIALARFFDAAIIFGAISAKEGTGGFDLPVDQLRALYEFKVTNEAMR